MVPYIKCRLAFHQNFKSKHRSWKLLSLSSDCSYKYQPLNLLFFSCQRECLAPSHSSWSTALQALAIVGSSALAASAAGLCVQDLDAMEDASRRATLSVRQKARGHLNALYRRKRMEVLAHHNWRLKAKTKAPSVLHLSKEKEGYQSPTTTLKDGAPVYRPSSVTLRWRPPTHYAKNPMTTIYS